MALQEDQLTAAGCTKIFWDHQTGSTKERPGLKDALAYVRSGDTLIVWRLDRLARSTKDLLSLVNQLQEQGVHFLSLCEAMDTTSVNGRLIFHIFAALAEFERDLIRERTQAGLSAARARGRQGGRPRKLSFDETRRLQELKSNPNLSIQELSKMFGMTKSSLYRYMMRTTP